MYFYIYLFMYFYIYLFIFAFMYLLIYLYGPARQNGNVLKCKITHSS